MPPYNKKTSTGNAGFAIWLGEYFPLKGKATKSILVSLPQNKFI
jgi:hypothetical protein